MSTSRKNKNSVFKEILVEDLLLFFSLFVIVFGGISSVDYADSQKKSNGFTSNFTDISVESSSLQVSQGIGRVSADFLFELGWSDSKNISSLFDFVINPISEILSKENPSLIASVNSRRVEGYVLGVSDSNDSDTEQKKEKTLHKDNGFILKYDNTSNKSVSLEYYLKDTKIQSVDFYIGESLVTHDTTYPYFLGGDEKGVARGYQIEDGTNVRVVVTFHNPPIYSVKTDSITIK